MDHFYSLLACEPLQWRNTEEFGLSYSCPFTHCAAISAAETAASNGKANLTPKKKSSCFWLPPLRYAFHHGQYWCRWHAPYLGWIGQLTLTRSSLRRYLSSRLMVLTGKALRRRARSADIPLRGSNSPTKKAKLRRTSMVGLSLAVKGFTPLPSPEASVVSNAPISLPFSADPHNTPMNPWYPYWFA